LLAVLAAAMLVTAQELEDYALFMSHTLEFPMVAEDWKNWETKGAAVLGRNKMYVNPEVKQRQGLVYNTQPLIEKQWIMDVEFSIGNSYNSVFGTNGMGIFILQEVLSKEIDNTSTFGYSQDYIGAAVFLNTGLRKKDPATGKRLEGVQGAVSDGSKVINTWEIPNEQTCYFKYRGEDDFSYNTIRLSYKQKQLDVLFYNKETEKFENCFNLSIDLTSGSFLAISGSSGIWDEDYHIIKSIRTMNPNKYDKGHKAEQDKKMRGEKYMESLKSTEDVMHKNRLQYENQEDLIQKLNHEIKIFGIQSRAVEDFIASNRAKLGSKAEEHTVDLNRMHADLDAITKDFFILERMLNHTYNKIAEAEQFSK
jgi:hypothetical protein